MCKKLNDGSVCGCCEYQGWSNSATWSVAYLIMQERPIYEKLVSIVKVRHVTANDIKEVWNTMKHEPKDEWVRGKVNFQEIADTHFNNEDYSAEWQKQASQNARQGTND